jgi:hypothetical protein
VTVALFDVAAVVVIIIIKLILLYRLIFCNFLFNYFCVFLCTHANFVTGLCAVVCK